MRGEYVALIHRPYWPTSGPSCYFYDTLEQAQAMAEKWAVDRPGHEEHTETWFGQVQRATPKDEGCSHAHCDWIKAEERYDCGAKV